MSVRPVARRVSMRHEFPFAKMTSTAPRSATPRRATETAEVNNITGRFSRILSCGRQLKRNEAQQRRQCPPRDQRTEGGATHSQNEIFCEKLPCETAAAASKRYPDRNLSFTVDQPGQNKAGQIRAGDYKQDAGCREYHEQDLRAIRSAYTKSCQSVPIALPLASYIIAT